MRLVIEPMDFKRLSSSTQSELLRLLSDGGPFAAAAPAPDAAADATASAAATTPTADPADGAAGKRPRLRWREPVDLTPELTQRLMHGINQQHKDRLRLFAERGGRVRMRELLAQSVSGGGGSSGSGDRDGGGPQATDVRALSHFEGAITRRLRRILGDGDKVAYLIGWDYQSTEWSADGAQIVDGVYYVSGPTTACLRQYFQLD